MHTSVKLLRQIDVLPWIGSKTSRELFGYLALLNVLEYSVVVAHRIWADRSSSSITSHALARSLLAGAKSEWGMRFVTE